MTEADRITITPEMQDELCAHRERTGVSSYGLLFGKNNDIPKGLDSGIINTWFAGKTASARKDYWDYVISLYEKLPDNPWIEIDDQLRARIQSWYSTLEMPLSKWMRRHAPLSEIKYTTLYSILKGRTSRVRKSVLDIINQSGD